MCIAIGDKHSTCPTCFRSTGSGSTCQEWQNKRRDIVDDSAPCNVWLKKTLMQFVSDKGGLVRYIRIKTKSDYRDRSIIKVCLSQEAENPKGAASTLQDTLQEIWTVDIG